MALAGKLLVSTVFATIALYAQRQKMEDKKIVFPDNPSDFSLPKKEIFDFIVVGAGTAGSILANRLSKNYSVLLLEGGGNRPALQSIPILSYLTRNSPDISFLYQSQKEKYVAGETGGLARFSTGKMLGGSRTHNGIHERGHPFDYDHWADLTKDASWRFENILHYFRKLENYQGQYFQNDAGIKGRNGPMVVTEDTFMPGVDIWLKAGTELGFKVADPNGHANIGFSPFGCNKKDGHQESTFDGYVSPLLKSGERGDNLKIYKHSFVSNVIFQTMKDKHHRYNTRSDRHKYFPNPQRNTNKRAIGVKYRRHGVPRSAFASKEVILSAGTFSSPIILIKSGIGPPEQTLAAKAKQVVALPVGQNLLDHPSVDITIGIKVPGYSWSIPNNLTFKDVDEYIESDSGPLTSSEFSAQAKIRSSRVYKNYFINSKEWSDIQIAFSYLTRDGVPSLGCYVMNTRPTSSGVLTLNASATSMEDNFLSVIRLNFYSDPEDFIPTIDGINFLTQIVESTEAFKKLGAHLVPYKPCEKYPFRSRKYWLCYIRYRAGSAYHGAGTCRMGYGSNDKRAVVDSKLRVLGVQGLRVVDASVIPYNTNANIGAPVMIIAEKAADDILHQYGD